MFGSLWGSFAALTWNRRQPKEQYRTLVISMGEELLKLFLHFLLPCHSPGASTACSKHRYKLRPHGEKSSKIRSEQQWPSNSGSWEKHKSLTGLSHLFPSHSHSTLQSLGSHTVMSISIYLPLWVMVGNLTHLCKEAWNGFSGAGFCTQKTMCSLLAPLLLIGLPGRNYLIR